MKSLLTPFSKLSTALFLLVMLFEASFAKASAITPTSVIDLMNQDRISQGLAPLIINPALSQAADEKARDMVNNGYFAHTSPAGLTPWYFIRKSGYDYHFAGENLAIRFVEAEDQEKAWMASPTHRENILSPKYQDVGVAVATTQQENKTVIVTVEEFGLLAGAPLPPALLTKVQGVSVKEEVTPLAVKVVDVATVTPIVQHDGLIQFLNEYTFHETAFLQGLGFLAVTLFLSGGFVTIFINRQYSLFLLTHKDWV
jgi:hypothetical protein